MCLSSSDCVKVDKGDVGYSGVDSRVGAQGREGIYPRYVGYLRTQLAKGKVGCVEA